MTVVLRMDPEEARALWHAACTTIELMDQAGSIPREAPLYGQRDRLAALARRLDHQINHENISVLEAATARIRRGMSA